MTNKYAIKSGTTNTDMWIIGYNKNAVLGVWTGYDDNRNFDSNVSGFHKDIWIETMEGYLSDKKNTWYEAPNNIIGVIVDPITGALVNEESKKGKIFYFLKGTEPYTEKTYDLEAVFNEENNSNLEEDGRNGDN